MMTSNLAYDFKIEYVRHGETMVHIETVYEFEEIAKVIETFRVENGMCDGDTFNIEARKLF